MGDQETNIQLRERIGHKEFKALQTNNPVPGKSPHVESLVTCSCGAPYCIVCDTQCPACAGLHIQPEPEVRLPDHSRENRTPWLHDKCWRIVGPGTMPLPKTIRGLSPDLVILDDILKPQIVTPFFLPLTKEELEFSAVKMICGPEVHTK